MFYVFLQLFSANCKYEHEHTIPFNRFEFKEIDIVIENIMNSLEIHLACLLLYVLNFLETLNCSYFHVKKDEKKVIKNASYHSCYEEEIIQKNAIALKADIKYKFQYFFYSFFFFSSNSLVYAKIHISIYL